MRRKKFILVPILMAMMVGCGKENGTPAVTTEATVSEAETVAATEDATEESEAEELESFPGVNVRTGAYKDRDYKEENAYFQDAVKAVAGLDFSSFSGNDEIQDYQYNAETGDGTDEIESWNISICNHDGFSKEFGSELLQLVQKQIPDATVEYAHNAKGENNPFLVEYSNEKLNAKVEVSVDSEDVTALSINAHVVEGGPTKKSEWVTNSTDYNFNLEDTFDSFVPDTNYSYADNAEFVDALIKDVMGLDFADFGDTSEISTFSISAYPMMEDDEQYAQQWILDLYTKDETMYSDKFFEDFRSLYQNATGEELEEDSVLSGQIGITVYSDDYSTNEGRIQTSVLFTNDPGGKRERLVPGVGRTEVNAKASGDITLHGQIDSDKYYEQAVG